MRFSCDYSSQNPYVYRQLLAVVSRDYESADAPHSSQHTSRVPPGLEQIEAADSRKGSNQTGKDRHGSRRSSGSLTPKNQPSSTNGIGQGLLEGIDELKHTVLSTSPSSSS